LVAFVHGNILTSFAICSLQSLGRVESRLFAEPSESIDIELKRPEPSGNGNSRSPSLH